ncbi:MAG: Ldh family oxidoreductase [Betaproteobacteria bacterium]|nr:Ldh family oxidoreductase [Betaproteobacteria bacterium]
MPLVSISDLIALAATALCRAGAAPSMARATARALVHAEASGVPTHGLARLALYCGHLRTGRAQGTAVPRIVRSHAGCCLIDAGGGLAYEALALAAAEAVPRAKQCGIALAGVTGSHHAGVMAYHLQPMSEAGMVGLAFTNSPAAINPWGGKRPLFGTNPIAAVFPRRDGPPLLIDLSLTEVVRGKIMLHAEHGKPIPLGWALDRDGNPTTDAKAALTGSLAAIGGAKGTMLALTVELLCCALTGAAFGFENDSFFEPGDPARIGHALAAIDPDAVAGREVFLDRIEALVAAMTADAGVRLPGSRRHAALATARAEGVTLSDSLLAQIRQLAA